MIEGGRERGMEGQREKGENTEGRKRVGRERRSPVTFRKCWKATVSQFKILEFWKFIAMHFLLA